MKKNIEIINADAPLLRWASDVLRNDRDRPKNADDLIRGLSELLTGDCSSLMIEPGDSAAPMVDQRVITCGALSIHLTSHRVTRDGKEIPLTPKEFDILCFLARNRGEVFTKEQIYQAVWDDEYLLDDSNIMAFIRKIRKKIEPSPDAPKYILTIWGIGYKFTESDPD